MQLSDYKQNFEQAVAFLKEDIAGLRTGRASVAMVEDISVEAYGTRQPIKAIASITISDAKTLMIDPWNKSMLGNVERGIRDSGLGVNPVNDGRGIRVTLPELTSERRVELAKILHQKLEQARVAVRQIREEIKSAIIAAEKDGAMSEDDRYRMQDDLEKMVKEYTEEVRVIGEKKETEISTV